ncbi:NADH-quinone oxidoreductase subunit L [Candidatus Legionella polyplacis]|uniref:NADH-quinone oxidoreductase subunit L n=1 Tax=Candidatus Legionella polyplacis TaxID=2005262 RepID=A0ABZ2GXQ3_9GAMM
MSIECLFLFIIILSLLFSLLFIVLFQKKLSNNMIHVITIFSTFTSLLLSVYIFIYFLFVTKKIENFNFLIWMSGGKVFPYIFHFGFLIDSLSCVMLILINFISLVVQIYSIGYMKGDIGYKRFFSYIILFTFMMNLLVVSNNFLQLFFAWEGVGLVSYLLISFWFFKEKAIYCGYKAFLINRIADFGFILGIGLILSYVGSLDYHVVFQKVYYLKSKQIFSVFDNVHCSLLTIISIFLFIGAMGKSAQIPLHIWLPGSMEGPTPISALLHSATMVVSGIFMLIRVSPLIEYSTVVLSLILIVGSTSAFFMGMVAITLNDIKSIIAYSTLSQLGYMMSALGVSAYSSSLFHLFNHAFFKALLFLSAGSVIICMSHEQNIKKMGGLWNKIPITYFSYLIGSLSLCSIPPFSGFYSKDSIIEYVKSSKIFGSNYAYCLLLITVFITSFYIFRSFFIIFHGKRKEIINISFSYMHEKYFVFWFPLFLLVIFSLGSGFFLYKNIFSEFSFLKGSFFVLPNHVVNYVFFREMLAYFYFGKSMFLNIAFILTIFGIFCAWICYIKIPCLPIYFSRKFSLIYKVLINQYGFDFLINYFVFLFKKIGNIFYKIFDRKIIDGFIVEGISLIILWFSKRIKFFHNGNLYNYVFVMILSVILLSYCTLFFYGR